MTVETMKITKDMKINDVIKKFPKTIKVFADFKIDSCCGGEVSIEKGCTRDKVDLNAILEALNKAA